MHKSIFFSLHNQLLCSCSNNGTLAQRKRSGHKKAIRSHSLEKQISTSSWSSSASSGSQTKRSWDETNMVQVFQAKQPRVDDSLGVEGRGQNGFDFAAEQQDKSRLQTLTELDVCAAGGRAEPPQLRLPTELNPGGAAAVAAERSTLAPRSWVIGPLFQSFRSKMATFTEIVMSPVKLFSAPSPPSPLPPTNHPNQDDSGSGDESDQQHCCQEETAAATAPVKCSKKLSFDNVEEPEQANEEPQWGRNLSSCAPMDRIPLLVNTGACAEPSLLLRGVEAEPADAPAATQLHPPQTRKCSGNGDKVPSKADRPQAIGGETQPKVDSSPSNSLHSHLTYADGGPRLSHPSSEELQRHAHPAAAAAAAAARRSAADRHSTEPLKKKRPSEARAPRPPRKKAASEGHVTRPAAKTRAGRKGRPEEKAAAVTAESRPDAETKLQSRAARCKVSQRPAGATMALETTIAITQLPEPQHIAVVLVRPLHATDERRGKRRSAANEGSALDGGTVLPPEGSRKKQKRAVGSFHSSRRNLQHDQVVGQRSTDPLYFEMTPPQPPPDLPALVRSQDKLLLDGAEQRAIGPHGSVSRSQRVTVKPLRDDRQGRCRVQVAGDDDCAQGDAHLPSTPPGPRSRLSRSLSCPELPSLATATDPHRVALSHPPRPCRSPASPQQQQQHLGHARKSPRRTRRHTVCSLEVERELAPLCLRKEVFPSRRSLPRPSPSPSFSTLASCFLSSPLAFLSKKAEPSSAGPSSPLTVSTSSPSLRPSSSSTWSVCEADPGGPTLDSGLPLPRDVQEEEEDSEDTSSSSPEFEDAALREEKALSDSEVKVVQKLKERGKVSSIRIRKAVPRPQNNLTPMGLPKAVRLKKKEFSLEEIYTNKNFKKPPESRLETIFEVPLKRRNGSESCFGQRRVKRFLEFLEAGEVRKPRKLLPAAAAAASSRTRRGSFPREEPAARCLQETDSVLCAKLEQLSLWLVHDGNASQQATC